MKLLLINIPKGENQLSCPYWLLKGSRPKLQGKRQQQKAITYNYSLFSHAVEQFWMQLQRFKSSMLAEGTKFKHKMKVIHISLWLFYEAEYAVHLCKIQSCIARVISLCSYSSYSFSLSQFLIHYSGCHIQTQGCWRSSSSARRQWINSTSARNLWS